MKNFKVFFFIFFIISYLFCSSDQPAIILKDTELKEQPSIKSKTIKELPKNENVILVEVSQFGDNLGSGYNYWKKVKMKDGSVGWVFGEYIATRYEMEIIAIAHSYKKTLYPEKDGLRGNPNLYEYCGIFYENGEWVVYFNYVIDHRKGECNTLAIFISNDKKILRIGCYS